MQTYNYVIYQIPSEYYRVSYSDLFQREDVLYIDSFPYRKLKFKKALHRIHHSKKINSFIRLPAKNLWYHSYFSDSFLIKRPLCFVFNARWMQYEYLQDYVLYLKKKFTKAKFVCFYQDLVNKHLGAEPNQIAHLFDLVLTYDKGDAEMYGFEYHPTVFSNFPVSIDYTIPESDVYFVGLAKDRLNIVIDIFYKLRAEGLICDFNLSGVALNQQIKEEGLNYIDKMNYIENLKHIRRTNCILEVVQNNAKGSTIRTWEAIMYDKKLLTNNLSIKDDFYYNKQFISLINDGNIDIEFIKQENLYNNPFKKHISPNNLLEFINRML